MGSPDCSQCLGREDLGHLCVWNDGCRLRGPLQPLSGTCPAPEIRAVSQAHTAFLARRLPPRAIVLMGHRHVEVEVEEEEAGASTH